MSNLSSTQYTLKRSANSKKISLNVSLQNGLEVTVPKGIRRSRIERVLEKNKDWIAQSLDQVSERLNLLVPNDIKLQAAGESWELEYQPTSSLLVSVVEKDDHTLLVQGKIEDKYEVALALRQWLTSKGHSHLVPWLHELSKEFNLPFNKVGVRGQRTRWGSCSLQGTISINRNLLFLPRNLVRYVLIHELVHTVQLDHSQKFWKLLLEREPLGRELGAEARNSWNHVPLWAYER